MRVELLLNRNCDIIVHEKVRQYPSKRSGFLTIDTDEAAYLYPVGSISWVKVID